MDYATGCDILVMAADTVVRQNAAQITEPRREGQTFSAWYVEHRVASMGYTKQQAAEVLGVSRTFFYELTKGAKKLSDSMVHSLVENMDFTTGELLVVRDFDLLEENFLG